MSDSDTPKLMGSVPGSLGSQGASFLEGFTVQFWGVRSSIPTPGKGTVRYGGNTACVEVMVEGQRLIFDGGTGLQELGRHLHRTKMPIQAHLFFTHAHSDRIQGFPFFVPAFFAENCFEIYGAPALTGASIKQCLTQQMLRPNFLTPLQSMAAELVFHNISHGGKILLDNGVQIEALSLNAGTSALGFRVTHRGRSLVYATDTGDPAKNLEGNLVRLAEDADLLVYSGTYSELSYADLNGASAISWEKCVELAKQARVKAVLLSQHNPNHDDEALDRMEAEISGQFPHIRFAREGMVVRLDTGDEKSPSWSA